MGQVSGPDSCVHRTLLPQKHAENQHNSANFWFTTLAGFVVQAKLLQFYGPDPWREEKHRLDFDKLLIRELVGALIDNEATVTA
jgi:hypothetical protein